MTYNYDFDNRKCRRDIVVNGKAYNINIGDGVEIWIEAIIQLASK